jgi:hypothetical protein
MFSVMQPSTVPALHNIFGIPWFMNVKAGLADAAHSSMLLTVTSNPMVGSAVTAQISLADAYGNPITSPPAGQYSNSRLVIEGALYPACSQHLDKHTT